MAAKHQGPIARNANMRRPLNRAPRAVNTVTREPSFFEPLVNVIKDLLYILR
jgi:hypothetical protein